MRVKFHLDPSNRLATVHERHRQTDRQRSGSIGEPFYNRRPKPWATIRRRKIDADSAGQVRSEIKLLLPYSNTASKAVVCCLTRYSAVICLQFKVALEIQMYGYYHLPPRVRVDGVSGSLVVGQVKWVNRYGWVMHVGRGSYL